MINSKIIGIGSYLPEKIYDNSYLESIVDTSDEWITERTGIKKRHIAGVNQFSSDLALQASLKAIKNANININDIDGIVLATTTPDLIFPSTATILQNKLNMKNNCFAFDIQAACSGFIFALDIANSFIKIGKAKNILVVSSETLSKIIDWKDRNTCVLFGDGAGAVILHATNEENKGILYSNIGSDGSYCDILKSKGGIRNSFEDIFIDMQGREVFKLAVNKMGESINDCLNILKLNTNDINLLIPHQANQRILDSIEKKLNLSPNVMYSTVSRHGNTASASIPLALDCALNENRIKNGDLILLEALGGGITWGSIAIKW